jgi:acid phosphatase family membrane protein YuiD
MVSASALASGLHAGFNSPVFGVATVLAMIVIYDATGIRRESGRQAVLINTIFEEISKGKIMQQKRLREVLGHTPGEAVMGTLLGLAMAALIWVLLL